MNGVTALLLLLPVTAAFALLQRRRLYAILGISVFSLLLSAVYLFAAAPDVAITEAAIGAALCTFVYVLAIRKTGRLVVAASEAPGLLQEEGGSVSGLEWEILDRVARGIGLDLVVQFVPYEEVQGALLRGDADVGAGGLIDDEVDRRLLAAPPHLPTARYAIEGPSDADVPASIEGFRGYLSDVIESVRAGEPMAVRLDLARFLALSRHGLAGYATTRESAERSYVFVVAPEKPEVHRRIAAEIERLQRSGEMDDMIRRHLA